MEGFITFLFFTIIIIFLLGRFLPLLLTWWVKKKLSKFSGNTSPFSERTQRGKKLREDDGTIVSDDVKRDKIVDSDIGEYVDYEESKKQ